MTLPQTIQKAAAALRSGAVTSIELTEASLKKIHELNDTVGAFIADEEDSGPEAQMLQHQLKDLIDEALTPDSSRYWPADTYKEGVVQPSFDKQFVRNWLTGPESGWDRHGSTPPPHLPASVVEATRERYIEAYERISGLKVADWIGA